MICPERNNPLLQSALLAGSDNFHFSGNLYHVDKYDKSFKGTVEIDLSVLEGISQIVLNSKELQIAKVEIDGKRSGFFKNLTLVNFILTFIGY